MEDVLAHAIGRSPLLLAQNIDDVPFDLRHWRCIVYQQSIRGGKQLADTIKKTISEDRYFFRVPMDALIEKFSGGYHVEKTQSQASFEGRRGETTHFTESWCIRVEAVAADLFYRKIRTDGILGELSGDRVTLEKRKFMEGIYFLTIMLDRPLRKGDSFDYGLTYDIRDGFAQKDEYWNFDVETDISDFAYEFDFSRTTDVESFTAFRKDAADSTSGLELRVEKEQKRFTVRDSELKIGQSILFRWTWRD